jgi:hypothetical protein
MMSAKREQAVEILNRIPKTPEGIRSDLQPELFLQWTGFKHEVMKQSWRENMNGPKLLTACGGFVSVFGRLIGITGIESYFELQKSLARAGKSNAWVPASSGADPQVGDILRHTVFHVDVAAGWDGRKLKRVAAGQSLHPRPTKNVENEFDALKWVTGAAPYNPANLIGWLDLDKYLGAASSVDPISGWLNGWWEVWDGNYYYYFFHPTGNVVYIETKPKSSAAPISPKNRGTYSFNSAGQLVVKWNAVSGLSPAIETFYNARQGATQMNAKSNVYSPLVATKIR